MYDQIIKLLGKKTVEKIPGQGKKTIQEEKEVFAELKDIGMREFYQAEAVGLKPELKFEIADYLDYNKEKELIFEDTKYQVLRTYRKGKALEITVYGGVNNADA